MKSSLFSLPSRLFGYGKNVWTYALAHKVIASVVMVAVVGGGYWTYSSHKANATTTQYVVASASNQSIDSTVTASGQVAANHQLDLSPKASGEVTSVPVKAGDTVTAGQVVATIDNTDALKTVRDAQLSLESAQIAYTQSITSSNNTLQNSQTTAATAGMSAFDSLTSAENSLSSVIPGIESIINGTNNSNFVTYQNIIDEYAPQAPEQRAQIQSDYKAALASYQQSFAAYQALNRTASPEDMQRVLTQVSATASAATALAKEVNAFLLLVQSTTQQHDLLTQPQSIGTQLTTATSYTTTMANTTSSLAGAQSSLTTSLQNYISNSQSISGGTPLAIQSAQLTLAKAKQALSDAQTDLEDYVVRAPFDGTIAEVDVQKFDQATTKVATLITKQQYAEISLNESDIAAIRTGQATTLTFDAIDNLTLQGTVAQVNQIGTVSNGVTTYTVKIGFDTQDARIRPGMTVNASIVTAHKDSALVVPLSAVKSQNGEYYVEVAHMTTAAETADRAAQGSSSERRERMASSTREFTSGIPGGVGSSASSSATGGASSTSRTHTVSTENVTVTRIPVTIGIEGDTMTEITSGIRPGELVVSQSLNATGKTTTTSSSGSILSRLFGGSRSTTRTTGATGSARATPGTSGTTRTTGSSGGFSGPPGGF